MDLWVDDGPPVDYDDDQPLRGSTADYCTRWPQNGHFYSAHKPSGTTLFVRICDGCRFIDGEDLERQVYDGHADHAEHRWCDDDLYVSGWDLARVRKVYSEQRAQYLAARLDAEEPDGLAAEREGCPVVTALAGRTTGKSLTELDVEGGKVIELMSAEESAQLAKLVAELGEYGYVDLPDYNGRLRVGTRVAHVGERWSDARVDGTGTVVALLERPNSPWSRDWHRRDIEMVVLRDEPGLFDTSSRLDQLAQYHVIVADRQPLDAEEAK